MASIQKNILDNFKSLEIKKKVCVVAAFLILIVLFLKYVPWIVGGKPISAIDSYELKNEPAPEWANSFAINHGSAIYYKDHLAVRHPVKLTVILVFFILLWGYIIQAVLPFRRSQKNDT